MRDLKLKKKEEIQPTGGLIKKTKNNRYQSLKLEFQCCDRRRPTTLWKFESVPMWGRVFCDGSIDIFLRCLKLQPQAEQFSSRVNRDCWHSTN